MRHFLRVDAGVGVGPSLGAVVFIENGETLHLDESDPEHAKVAESVASASSGWVEVDESGKAVPRRRKAKATATVSQVGEPDATKAEETV